ncbi:MAG: aminodeoxychorismate lyase [Pseudomonadota bacterium]
MIHWTQNGAVADSVNIADRAVQYGDGLFETLSVFNGKPHHWDYHMERLALGCERLGLQAPDRDSLERQLTDALATHGLSNGLAGAKIIVTAGASERGYRRSPNQESTVLVGVFKREHPKSEIYANGVAVRICTTRLATQPQLAGIKSLNRLEQVLARAEWSDPSIFEGLMRDTEGHVICGTMSNVFAVIDNRIVTPGLDRCGVSGVMRRHTMTTLAARNIPVAVEDLTVADLRSADEVFLTNSLYGVVPVSTLEDVLFTVGPTVRDIHQAHGADA